MFCYRCGKPLEEMARFCNHCGSVVAQLDIAGTPESEAEKPETVNSMGYLQTEVSFEAEEQAAAIAPEAQEDVAQEETEEQIAAIVPEAQEDVAQEETEEQIAAIVPEAQEDMVQEAIEEQATAILEAQEDMVQEAKETTEQAELSVSTEPIISAETLPLSAETYTNMAAQAQPAVAQPAQWSEPQQPPIQNYSPSAAYQPQQPAQPYQQAYHQPRQPVQPYPQQWAYQPQFPTQPYQQAPYQPQQPVQPYPQQWPHPQQPVQPYPQQWPHQPQLPAQPYPQQWPYQSQQPIQPYAQQPVQPYPQQVYYQPQQPIQQYPQRPNQPVQAPPHVAPSAQPALPLYSTLAGAQEQSRQRRQSEALSKFKSKLKENKRLLFSLIAILTLIVLVGGLFTGLYISRVSRYNKAQEYFSQGNFAAARELYFELEDFRDSADRLIVTDQNIDYVAACAAFESAIQARSREQFERAQAMFVELGSFKNSDSQAVLCGDYLKYFEAEDLLAAGAYYDAYLMFRTACVYDYDDRALECTLPYPENGVVYRNPDYTSRAISVTFKNDVVYPTYIKMYAENGDLVLTLFLEGNSSTTVYFGSGSYKFNRAIADIGGYWFGETDVFGSVGDYMTCMLDDSQNPYSQFSSNYNYTIIFYESESDEGSGVSLPIDRGSF